MNKVMKTKRKRKNEGIMNHGAIYGGIGQHFTARFLPLMLISHEPLLESKHGYY
jgi:hypothetical protein